MGYVAFVLDDTSREMLLTKYRPAFERVIAHHVTLEYGCHEADIERVITEFGHIEYVTVLGHASGNGVSCVAVEINGRRRKQNGYHLHITLSVAEGVEPVAANQIADAYIEAKEHLQLNGQYQYVR